MERRRLHNQLQELKGNIRVFCCVRPHFPPKTPISLPFPPQVPPFPPVSALFPPPRSAVSPHFPHKCPCFFPFSPKVPVCPSFHPKGPQSAPLAPPNAPISPQRPLFPPHFPPKSALDGYPVCIFAYGQTGSGKTYTMEGPGGADPTSWGVIPRAVRHLFGGARQLEHKGWQYSFSASFLEIYNEVLRDLLGGDKGDLKCSENL
eukprot:XP_027304675.1 kinesin-like protein KIFC1 [Anas platyrhynchos]